MSTTESVASCWTPRHSAGSETPAKLHPNPVDPLDGRLTAALPDGAVQLYPETTTRFFVKEVDAQVLFQVDGDGHPTGAFLYQTGQDPISITVER